MDIKGLSEHINVSEKKADKIYNELFRLIRNETSNPLLNTIHLQGWGKFYVKKITIDKLILAYINQIRNGKNVEKNKELIRGLWEARKGKSYIRI